MRACSAFVVFAGCSVALADLADPVQTSGLSNPAAAALTRLSAGATQFSFGGAPVTQREVLASAQGAAHLESNLVYYSDLRAGLLGEAGGVLGNGFTRPGDNGVLTGGGGSGSGKGDLPDFAHVPTPGALLLGIVGLCLVHHSKRRWVGA